MFKTIAVITAVLIAAVLIVAGARPKTFRVQRAARIHAPPEKVFALINDFQRWAVWSPWDKRDPAMKRTFGSLTSDTGAVYAWEGNKEVGQGQMEITESVPPSRIRIRLDFIKPFKAHNTVEFTLEPLGDATQVTWLMQGENAFLGKVVGLFVNMDRMVGKDFETGLANLKAAAEA